MKKYFSIFAFVLLLVTQVFGQAAVDIPILVQDNAGTFRILQFGLDLQATSGIDTLLGEGYGGPPPPGNIFDAYWWLPPFDGSLLSLRDYRTPGNPPAFPFTGSIQYSLKFQTIDFPITVSWDLPPEIAMTSLIQDVFGGVFISQVFAGTDSVIITNPVIAQLLVFVDYDNIIPVELISFNASVLEKTVQLNWTTATEINNSGFEVQRTSPLPSPYQGEGGEAGRGWEAIGFVPGFGTTTEPKSYSYVDEDVTSGTYKYRLKQIDFDGTFEYSNEIEVEVDFTPEMFVLYQNYPNPFNPSTTIKYEIPNVETTRRVVFTTLKIYDILGNEVATLVNEEKQPGVYEVEFDASTLASGMYLYKLKAGTFVQTKKMILSK